MARRRTGIRSCASSTGDARSPTPGGRARVARSSGAAVAPGPPPNSSDDELAAAGVVGAPDGVGMRLVAPTILEHGSDDLRSACCTRRRPGSYRGASSSASRAAGSDLAGLTTRARLDGDGWVIDGQKVWTTSAHHADLGLLLARSDGTSRSTRASRPSRFRCASVALRFVRSAR